MNPHNYLDIIDHTGRLLSRVGWKAGGSHPDDIRAGRGPLCIGDAVESALFAYCESKGHSADWRHSTAQENALAEVRLKLVAAAGLTRTSPAALFLENDRQPPESGLHWALVTLTRAYWTERDEYRAAIGIEATFEREVPPVIPPTIN